MSPGPLAGLSRTIHTFHDLLSHNLPARSEKLALVDGERSWTYAQLELEAGRVAAWLISAGVTPGDRVGIHLPKCSEEVIATLAVARIGAVFVNVHPQWTAAQLQHVLDDCTPRVLVTHRRRARELLQQQEPLACAALLVVGEPPEDPRATSWQDLPPWRVDPDPRIAATDLAAILYTSGSTGAAKGVMLSHANLIRGAEIVSGYLENCESDRVLGLLPLSFDYGLSQLTTMFAVGGTLVLEPVSMPAELARSLERHRITGLAGVPTVWVQLIQYASVERDDPKSAPTWPHLRYVTNSGGSIPAATLAAMPALFGPDVRIYLMYGLTEAFRSTYLAPEKFAAKAGSLGQAVPGEEVYVIAGGRGLCKVDEVGELVHRGGLICQGYWQQPEATALRIRPCPELREITGDEPVLYSGDLVRRDADGDLWFVGRQDALIKSSGFRISPDEVEQIVQQCPGVRQAVAYGRPDRLLGQVVEVAFSASDPSTTAAQVTDGCRQRMPAYMVPRRVTQWAGELPRLGNGKIDRQAVIARMLECDSETSAP